jgi:hypothetical protein
LQKNIHCLKNNIKKKKKKKKKKNERIIAEIRVLKISLNFCENGQFFMLCEVSRCKRLIITSNT